MAQHDGRIERVFESGILADLFRHAPSAIDHHRYLLAAFGLQIARYQETAFGADFPVDRPQVFTRRIGQQTFEIRSVPVDTPRSSHGFVLMMDARQQAIFIGRRKAGIDAKLFGRGVLAVAFSMNAPSRPARRTSRSRWYLPRRSARTWYSPFALTMHRKRTAVGSASADTAPVAVHRAWIYAGSPGLVCASECEHR